MRALQFPDKVNVNDAIQAHLYKSGMAELVYNAIDAHDVERIYNKIGWHIRCHEDIESFVQQSVDSQKNGTAYNYAIFAEGQFAGNLDIFNISYAKSCEIGYWLLRAYEGKGIISKTLEIIEAMLFKAGLNRISITCNADDQRANNVPKRNGYKYEGCLRQAEYIHGTFKDLNVYGKIATDSMIFHI